MGCAKKKQPAINSGCPSKVLHEQLGTAYRTFDFMMKLCVLSSENILCMFGASPHQKEKYEKKGFQPNSYKTFSNSKLYNVVYGFSMSVVSKKGLLVTEVAQGNRHWPWYQSCV